MSGKVKKEGLPRAGSYEMEMLVRERTAQLEQDNRDLKAQIAERQRIEKMLRASEQTFRSIVENSHAGIFIIDDRYSLTYVNDMVSAILGYTPEQVLGKDFRSFLDEESKKIVAERYIRRQRGEGIPNRYEFNIIRKDGSKRRVELSSTVVKESDGRARTIGQVLDITGRNNVEEELRKAHEQLESRVAERTLELEGANSLLQNEIARREQTHEALRKSELKYRHLIQSANTIILEMDPKGRVIFFNKFAERFFGFEESEILGRSVVGTIVPPADSAGRDLDAMIEDIVRNPESYRHNENENMRRNGERVWIVWTNQPLYDGNGNLKEILCVGIDRTVQKRSEEMLAQQAGEKAAAEERNCLARDLHDAVSQTLFSASLIAEVLPRLWERSQDEGRKRLEEIRQLTRGALAQMRTLLLELRPAALVDAEPADLLRQLAESVTGRARIPVTVEVKGEGALTPPVKVALYRIAQEALNNVVKHSGATLVGIIFSCQPDNTELSVSDNGKGFDMDSASPGRLGLGIMHERANGIGASLSVKSKIGHGTTVVVVYKGISGGKQ